MTPLAAGRTGEQLGLFERRVGVLPDRSRFRRPTKNAHISGGGHSAYNGAEFIEEAIQSVLRQTEPADEILVVDDGSTDEGPEIVRALSKLNPIILLSKPNGGQSSARKWQ